MGDIRVITLGAIIKTEELPSGIVRVTQERTMSGILARERSAWIGWDKQ